MQSLGVYFLYVFLGRKEKGRQHGGVKSRPNDVCIKRQKERGGALDVSGGVSFYLDLNVKITLGIDQNTFDCAPASAKEISLKCCRNHVVLWKIIQEVHGFGKIILKQFIFLQTFSQYP